MKITQREKVLLTILFTVIILVGGFMLVIVPQNERKQLLSVEANALEMEALNMKQLIANRKNIEEDLEIWNQNIKDSLDVISDPLVNETFDSFVNGLAIRHDIKIGELRYSNDTIMIPSVEYGVPEELEYALKSELQKLNEIEDEKVEDKVSEYEIIHKSIFLDLAGTSSNIKDFVDALYTGGYKTIYVNQLDLSVENETGSVTLDLFSIDKVK